MVKDKIVRETFVDIDNFQEVLKEKMNNSTRNLMRMLELALDEGSKEFQMLRTTLFDEFNGYRRECTRVIDTIIAKFNAKEEEL